MKTALLLRALTISLVAIMVTAVSPAGAQAALDKVSFGTNWVAEAEHGGFFQAVADGTYQKYGLDVTIVPGGPNDNNRMLLIAGKIDFFMAANTLMSFDAISNNVPVVAVAAIFQKDPQVFLTHPESKITKLEELKPADCAAGSAAAVSRTGGSSCGGDMALSSAAGGVKAADCEAGSAAAVSSGSDSTVPGPSPGWAP